MEQKNEENKTMMLQALIMVFIVLFPLCGYSAIYGYVDERGIYHFTNITPIGKKYHTVIPDKSKYLLGKGLDSSNTNNKVYDPMIVRHSQTHGIDPSLVKAVMKAESNFNPNAVSPKGAQGLMQLMPDTAKLMKVENPFDPDENIKGGTRYLKFLENTFQGNIELMLAAYNAGPSRVMEYKRTVPPIEETINFIKRVKYYYNKLKNPHEG
ncbi:MAG: lytic transglycosylase [Syntrophus sp. (in: bacteria)]|nr:lytic transglycosylase [Syntrophus sp. (in: bacteria)]